MIPPIRAQYLVGSTESVWLWPARLLTHQFSTHWDGSPTQTVISYWTNNLLSSYEARPCDNVQNYQEQSNTRQLCPLWSPRGTRFPSCWLPALLWHKDTAKANWRYYSPFTGTGSIVGTLMHWKNLLFPPLSHKDRWQDMSQERGFGCLWLCHCGIRELASVTSRSQTSSPSICWMRK